MEVTDDFNAVDFEQRLTNLKDTQDSIQAMSAWCLKHRPNHKKVVSSWLNVLKQVKVEHRLILFYLANDVIQYSKRKNYEFVDSWGTTLQRATTMVRDEKVKHKIIRIFNIWEQRGIYNDEFLADLHDLLSINPTKKQQPVDSDDEQASILSSNIRNCVRLEKETDKSFKILSKTPLCDTENIHSLKDRRHVEDVERDIENHVSKLESYIKSLNTEIKARTILLAVLEQTDAFYHNQRGDVKVVANAYRNFGNRIKTMKKKLDDLCTKLPSPIPSPDINAPSPEPDNEYDLDNTMFDQQYLNKQSNGFLGYVEKGSLPFDINDFKNDSPKDSSDAQPIQVIGSSAQSTTKKDLDFNIDEFFKSIMPDVQPYTPNTPQPVPPVPDYAAPPSSSSSSYGYNQPQNSYNSQQNVYRPPPPMPMQQQPPYQLRPPPLNSHFMPRLNAPFNQPYNPHGYHPQQQQQQPQPPPLPQQRPRYPMTHQNTFNSHMPLAPPPIPPAFDGNLSDEYNPESWDIDMNWNSESSHLDDTFNQSSETPVSPPHFERKGVGSNVIEYIDPSTKMSIGSGSSTADVDHRRIPMATSNAASLPSAPINKDKARVLDVDHRNLISLTGSPGPAMGKMTSDLVPPPLQPPNLWKGDIDFRHQSIEHNLNTSDLDYRLKPPPAFPVDFLNNSSSNSSTSDKLISAPAVSMTVTANKQKQQQISSLESPKLNKLNEQLLEIKSPTCSSSSGGVAISAAAKSKQTKSPTKQDKLIRRNSGAKLQNGPDNVESIDMEMSDEDFENLPDFDDAFEEDETDENPPETTENFIDSDQLPDIAENQNVSTGIVQKLLENERKPEKISPLFSTPPPNFRNPFMMASSNFPPPRFGHNNNMPIRQWGGGNNNFNNNNNSRHNFGAPPPRPLMTIKVAPPVESLLKKPLNTPDSIQQPEKKSQQQEEVVLPVEQELPKNTTDQKTATVISESSGSILLDTKTPPIIITTTTTIITTTSTKAPTKRVNPFSQQPKVPIGDISSNEGVPWHNKRQSLDQNVILGTPQNTKFINSPQANPNIAVGLPIPLFHQQQSPGNQMAFRSPMRGGGIRMNNPRGGGGGGVQPFFRPRMNAPGTNVNNNNNMNNIRGNFRHNFRGRGGGGGGGGGAGGHW